MHLPSFDPLPRAKFLPAPGMSHCTRVHPPQLCKEAQALSSVMTSSLPSSRFLLGGKWCLIRSTICRRLGGGVPDTGKGPRHCCAEHCTALQGTFQEPLLQPPLS